MSVDANRIAPLDTARDLTNAIVASVIFLATLIVYTITLTPNTPFWDGGEYIASSYILGVPHAPGTPLYVLIGRIFSLIPIGTVAQRVNWFSAISSSVAVMLTYLITVKVTRRSFPWEEGGFRRVLAYVGGAVAALIAAFATTFWDNAIEAEVYAASCALMAFIVWLALRWSERLDEGTEDGLLLVITYLVGLGVGIHLGVTIASWAAVVFVFVIRPQYLQKWDYLGWALVTLSLATGIHEGAFLVAPAVLVLTLGVWVMTGKLYRLALWAALLFIIGVSVHFYLIIRSNLDPIINEAAPKDWDALWKMLIRDQYKPPPITERKAEFGFQFNHMYLRYLIWNFKILGSWAREYTPADMIRSSDVLRGLLQPPVVLAVIGAAANFIRDRKSAILIGVLFFLLGPAMVVYLNFKVGEVRERDYFFVQNFMFLSIWVGVGVAFVIHWLRNQVPSGARNGVLVGAGAALLVMSFVPLVRNWESHDRRGFYVARDYAYNMLAPLELDAVIFTNGDNDTFPLWYIQEVEGVRKDVRVINLSLLNTGWYIRQLRDLDPKVPIAWTDDQIDRLQPYRDRQGKIWLVKDTAVEHILETNQWRKPAYLAVTVPDQMGLSDQLQMEGLAFRIHPEPVKQRISIEKSRRNLHEIYSYRGLVLPAADGGFGVTDTTVYKDDNATKLVQNYAAAFSRLAFELYQQGKPDEALQEMDNAAVVAPTFSGYAVAKGIVLENLKRFDEAKIHYRKMMERFPQDWQIPFRMGNTFVQTDELAEAIPYYQRAIALAPPSEFVPTQALTSAYYQTGQYEAAIEVLQQWLLRNPTDPQGVRPLIQELRESLERGRRTPPAENEIKVEPDPEPAGTP